ncbi:hypothetical protein HPP92_002619 [Vanilla planifolia]|uniref:RING-type E3 ubiquitin transferase n=1 Tax=Vanilla planifolia TaxID=51239 RepID=A0A835SF03_VANPL|nr:hypothetical protein HPP92_002619 [Vanilla planifolia]
MQVSQRTGFGRLHTSMIPSTHCLNRLSIPKQATRISSLNEEPSAQRSNHKTSCILSTSKVLSAGSSSTISAPKCNAESHRTTVDHELLPNPKGMVLSTLKGAGLQKECTVSLIKSPKIPKNKSYSISSISKGLSAGCSNTISAPKCNAESHRTTIDRELLPNLKGTVLSTLKGAGLQKAGALPLIKSVKKPNHKSCSISSTSKALSAGCSSTLSAPKCNVESHRTAIGHELLPNPKGKVLSTLKGAGLQKEFSVSLIKSTKKPSLRTGCEDLYASKPSSTKHLIASRDAEQPARNCTQVAGPGPGPGSASPKHSGRMLQAEDAQSRRRSAREYNFAPNSDTVSATFQGLSEHRTGVSKTGGVALTTSVVKPCASNSSSTKYLIASRDAKQAIRDCIQVAEPQKSVAPMRTSPALEVTGAQSMHSTTRVYNSLMLVGDISSTLQGKAGHGTGAPNSCDVTSARSRRRIYNVSGCAKLCAYKTSSRNNLTASRNAKQATKNCSQDAESRPGAKKSNQKNYILSAVSKSNASGRSNSISASKCTGRQLETADPQSMRATERNRHSPPSLRRKVLATLQKLSEDGIRVQNTCTSALNNRPGRQRDSSSRTSENLYKISSTRRQIASVASNQITRNCSQDAGPGAQQCDKSCRLPSFSKVFSTGYYDSISAPRRVNVVMKKHEGKFASRTDNMCTHSCRKREGSPITRVPTMATTKATKLVNKSQFKAHSVKANTRQYAKTGSRRGMLTIRNPHHPLPEAAMTAQVQETEFSFLNGRWSSSSRSAVHEPAFGSRGAHGGSALARPSSTEFGIADGSLNNGVVEEPWMPNGIEDLGNADESFLRDNNDQYWELRMDIDNMSYEDLLALEEQMGSVSTGLTDEALTKCLKRVDFKQPSSASGFRGCVPDEKSCSICQEECVDGEEIGILECEHCFHAACIEQWLRLKNWCPICKASALK